MLINVGPGEAPTSPYSQPSNPRTQRGDDRKVCTISNSDRGKVYMLCWSIVEIGDNKGFNFHHCRSHWRIEIFVMSLNRFLETHICSQQSEKVQRLVLHWVWIRQLFHDERDRTGNRVGQRRNRVHAPNLQSGLQKCGQKSAAIAIRKRLRTAL